MSEIEREVIVVLLYWDPIGILGHGHEVEEYRPYVSRLVEMVAAGADQVRFFDHLRELERTSMGLSSSSPRTREAAQRLTALR
jgi:hypothetical protein